MNNLTEMSIAFAYTSILKDEVKKINDSQSENMIEGIVYYNYEESNAQIVKCTKEDASALNSGFDSDSFKCLCYLFDETKVHYDKISTNIDYELLEAIILKALNNFKFTEVELQVFNNPKMITKTVYDGTKIERREETLNNALHNIYICAKW